MSDSANLGPKNTKLPSEQNSTYSFLAYKTSGFVMRAKPPNTNEKTPPKLYENPPFFWCQILRMHSPKQPKTLRFNRIRGKNTFWFFWAVSKNLKKRTQTKFTLFWSTTDRARNPFKTSAKCAEGNPDSAWCPDSPFETLFLARIPLLQHIYIYVVELLSGPRFGVFNSYYLGHVCFFEKAVCQKTL